MIVFKNSTFRICHLKFFIYLQRLHPEQHKDHVTSKPHSTEDKTIQLPIPSFLAISQAVEQYDKKNPKQKQFQDSLLQFVVLDCVPLQITEGQGFQNLIHRLDPKLRIPSRRTLGRMLNAQHLKVSSEILCKTHTVENWSIGLKVLKFIFQVVKEMTLLLKDLPPHGCHLILDIWSSKQKMSVIGFKGQFIKDWKMKRLVLGFKHFPEKHTGVNIKKALDDLLQEIFKLEPKQVEIIKIKF